LARWPRRSRSSMTSSCWYTQAFLECFILSMLHHCLSIFISVLLQHLSALVLHGLCKVTFS
jgi:hypothetical protein